MVFSAFQYLSSLTEPYGLTRTLTDVHLCRDRNGTPIYSVGNSAVVFKAMVGGRICALRCYTRPKRNLQAIYREQLLRGELFVYTDDGNGEWCDVVVSDWVEGVTLQTAILAALGNSGQMKSLAERFDALACDLLAQDWAHGDVKPENIIVGADGGLYLIDFDAMYRPCFTADDCEESGTRAFQHPDRAEVFGKEIDDYPIALISTSLHALALDSALWSDDDALPVSPAKAVAGEDATLAQIEQMFAAAGDAVRYRVARLLRSPQPRLNRLRSFRAMHNRITRRPTKSCILPSGTDCGAIATRAEHSPFRPCMIADSSSATSVPRCVSEGVGTLSTQRGAWQSTAPTAMP